MLNWQKFTVSTHSLGKLWGAEVLLKGLVGIAVVHYFLKSPRHNRSDINATMITMYIRNIHFGGGNLIPRFHDDGKHWVAIERFQILVITSVQIFICGSKVYVFV